MDLDFLTNNKLLYGKIIEISGAISYKTSCMLSIVRHILAQDSNAIVLYIDSDNHMRLQYILDYTIDKDRCILGNCNDPFYILSIIKDLKEYYNDRLYIIIDSISNLNFNSPFKDLSKFMIQLSKLIYNTKIIVYIVNQFRYNTDQKRYITYCSKCFDLYSSLRLIIMNKINHELYLKTQKNKITNDLDSFIIDIGITNNECSVSESRE